MKDVFEKTLAKGSYAWSFSLSVARRTNSNEDDAEHVAREDDANVDTAELNSNMNDDYFDGIRVIEDIDNTPYDEDNNHTRPSKAMPRRPNEKNRKTQMAKQ